MMLAVVGYVDGSEPEAAVGDGAGVEVGGAGRGVVVDVDMDAYGVVLAPATPDPPDPPRPEATEGIKGNEDGICPTVYGKGGAGGNPYPGMEPETALAAAMMAEAAETELGSMGPGAGGNVWLLYALGKDPIGIDELAAPDGVG